MTDPRIAIVVQQLTEDGWESSEAGNHDGSLEEMAERLLAKLDSARPEPSGDATPNEAEPYVYTPDRPNDDEQEAGAALAQEYASGRYERLAANAIAQALADARVAASSQPVKQEPADVVERVALALFAEEMRQRASAAPSGWKPIPFHEWPESDQAAWCQLARAALSAIHESSRQAEALGMARELAIDPDLQPHQRASEDWFEWSISTERTTDAVQNAKSRRMFVRVEPGGMCELLEARVTSDSPRARQLEGQGVPVIHLTNSMLEWLMKVLPLAHEAKNADEEKARALVLLLERETAGGK